MPIFRNRNVLELFRGVKVFMSLNVGFTRGSVPILEHLESPERGLYLEMMRKSLTGWVYVGEDLRRNEAYRSDHGKRKLFEDWPETMHTMIGFPRLENLQYCLEKVLKDHTPGDLIETGVWRGSTTIFMRAILKAHGVRDRRVWVADSFEGLPPPDAGKYPQGCGR